LKIDMTSFFSAEPQPTVVRFR